MKINDLESLFLKFKENTLRDRYLPNNLIEPLLKKLPQTIAVKEVGKSVLNNPIYTLTFGSGKKRILMWSQMHGNESTTTKAVFDLLNTVTGRSEILNPILETCTICIIPILNPDGANVYTRINANAIDLNRDAQWRTQPESRLLRSVFEEFKPNYCYNLHGQRTIFSAGKTNKPATISFLAPAQDEACSITPNRMVAMEIISKMNDMLQKVIPNQVGIYDDAFNINCVGDTFQNENIPTMLFEAGHYANDYDRNLTRKFIYMSLLTSLNYISTVDSDGSDYKSYFKIPENDKCFLDIIIRNAKVRGEILDVGMLYQERLVNGKIDFIPRVEKLENLKEHYGHKEIDAKGRNVLDLKLRDLEIETENEYVLINNENISLLSK